MTRLTGECFCGAIQYEISGALPDARACHCSRCRKAFSGTGSAVSWIDPAKFRWLRGEHQLRAYTNKHGLGLGFCERCGSTLCGLNNGDVACITLGTLNGDPDVEIGQHIFVGSKASWDDIGGSAPQYDEWPEAQENTGR